MRVVLAYVLEGVVFDVCVKVQLVVRVSVAGVRGAGVRSGAGLTHRLLAEEALHQPGVIPYEDEHHAKHKHDAHEHLGGRKHFRSSW